MTKKTLVAIGFLHVGLAEMLMNLYICRNIRGVIIEVEISSDINASGTTYLNYQIWGMLAMC